MNDRDVIGLLSFSGTLSPSRDRIELLIRPELLPVSSRVEEPPVVIVMLSLTKMEEMGMKNLAEKT